MRLQRPPRHQDFWHRRRTIFGRRSGQAGFSLVEMTVVCTVLVILAAVTLPVAKNVSRRTKEAELRHALRTMRNSIDEYKRYADVGLLGQEGQILGTEGYPEELEILIEGVEIVGMIDYKKRFLRKIPIDPMTGDAEWGLRSYQDEPDSTSWGGENVFDVYSLSEAVGLNGVPYSEW